MGVNVINYCDSVTPIVLDSIGRVIFDNDTLKVQYLSYRQRYFDDEPELEKINIKVTEKVGSISGFLHIPMCAYETSVASTALRCYDDNEIHYEADWWKNHFPDADCDELINNTAVPSAENKKLVNIYPNPVIDFLSIDLNANGINIFTVALYTIYGEKLMTKKNCTRLDMQHLPSGIYLLHVIQNGDNMVFKINKK